ncbi:MAG TPA: oxidoreductase [Vicinamibacterales bacterium]|jgi:NADPH2:quinone reductase
MQSFKAFRIFNEDGKIAGRVVDATLDELTAGEVVIKAEYSSVNYKDALAATGVGKIIRKFPLIGGIDVAGTVSSSNDPAFKTGDRVLVTGYDLGVAHDGGYAQYVRVPAAWVVHVPDGLTTLEAMTLGTAGFTAALAVVRLERNGLAPSQGKVVVTGATGGVGSIAVAVLSRLGYDVTAITGKDEAHDYLESLGANAIIDRKTMSLGTRPLEAATWAGAVDAVGGDLLAWLTRTMGYWGSIASTGLTGGIEVHTTVMPFILRGVSLIGIDSAMCPMDVRTNVWQRLASAMKPARLESIAHTVSFDQLPPTFATLLDGRARGRYVVQIH